MDAYFFFDDRDNESTLQVCREDSLICSRLKHIAKTPDEACKLFGYPVNPLEFPGEDLYSQVRLKQEVDQETLEFNASCHNGTPGSTLYGKPTRSTRYNSYKRYESDEKKEGSAKKRDPLRTIKDVLIGIIVLIIVLFVLR